jgi:hypothetical protein
VSVPVVDVGNVGMRVHERFVLVQMRVSSRDRILVMTVVVVVLVFVVVRERLVLMDMDMVRPDHEQHADGSEEHGDELPCGEVLRCRVRLPPRA